MNKIEQMVKEMCPGGVECVFLGSLIELYTGEQFNKSELAEIGMYPVINGGVLPSGYSDKKNESFNTITISQGGASAGYVSYQKTDFWAGAHCFVVRPKGADVLNNRYLYHFLKECQSKLQSKQQGAGIPSVNRSVIKDLQIPLPPLPIQEAIVEILDKFESLQQGLQDELQARKKQYEYYRNKLLTQFPDNVEVKEYTLGEIAIYSKERIDCTLLNPNNYVSVENLLQNKQGKIASSCVPTTGNWIKFSPKDILIGNIRPYLQKIWLADCNGGTNGDVLCIRIADKYRNDIIPEFLYYVLSSNDFFDYDTSHSGGGKMPRGDKKAVLKYPIIIPSKQEQQGIVSILDHFETLVNDQEKGIPAEIAAVKKQYEYYRIRLLNLLNK